MTGEAMPVYPWQLEIWTHLLAYIGQQRIPQALLLSGPAGLGKRDLTEVYAGALLCHAPLAGGLACGLCHGCRLFQARTHPDFICIEPDEPGKGIGIDKIRQLIVKLALKPQYQAYRLVIVQPADGLNNAAANAFLKCLEEPGERTGFVLIAEQAAKLPATIRSRCQKIHLAPPDRQIAGDWLMQQGVKEDVEQLLNMAQGAPLLAKVYAERNFCQYRREFFDAWLQIAQGKTDLLAVADRWQKQEFIELFVLLTWLSTWVIDLVKLAHGVDNSKIVNTDFKKPLQALAERLELKDLYRYYDLLLGSRSQLSAQTNKQLLTERLLIDWSLLTRH